MLHFNLVKLSVCSWDGVQRLLGSFFFFFFFFDVQFLFHFRFLFFYLFVLVFQDWGAKGEWGGMRVWEGGRTEMREGERQVVQSVNLAKWSRVAVMFGGGRWSVADLHSHDCNKV